MLGSQGRLFFLFGRRRGSRSGNGRLKVCPAEKRLRTELCQELGLYVPHIFLRCLTDPRLGLKIDYFNQRRVLAEKQKPLLAQAASQAAEAKRRS